MTEDAPAEQAISLGCQDPNARRIVTLYATRRASATITAEDIEQEAWIDIIRTLRANKDYIGHYHTGGNPGRNEIDDTQELYYPAIMRAILETGYKGHVGQEFIPKREDKLASLEQGVRICDV